jgi:hypothetical protein
MPALTIKYVYEDVDRHGNARRYLRKRIAGGTKYSKIRLRADPTTDPAAFHAEYASALAKANTIAIGLPKAEAEVGLIYFVGFGGRIKIGFTTNLERRLSALQTSCPAPLTIQATIPGTRLEEKRLHKRFAHLKLSGEWFRLSKTIINYIASVGHAVRNC